MIGFSVYSLQAEWPNFFRFVVAFAMFAVATLIAKVRHASCTLIYHRDITRSTKVYRSAAESSRRLREQVAAQKVLLE